MTPLHPHPNDSPGGVTGITVETAISGGNLILSYLLRGDLSRLVIPESARSRHRDNLWRHTCFEAFVGTAGQPAYLEFNFSPSGEWAAYSFRRYRDGLVLDLDFPPAIFVERQADTLRLVAELDGECLPAAGPWKLGLSAVTETLDGRTAHWALRHPPGRPDFHHTDAFALQLDPP